MNALYNETVEIFLPTTEEAFDKLIDDLVETYKLPSKEHATAVVANRIQHLPPDQATTTMKYLGHCVLKNIAFQIAQSKHQKVTHKLQIDQLIQVLKGSPNDAQARDAIDKEISEGSEYAKEELAKLDNKPELTLVASEQA